MDGDLDPGGHEAPEDDFFEQDGPALFDDAASTESTSADSTKGTMANSTDTGGVGAPRDEPLASGEIPTPDAPVAATPDAPAPDNDPGAPLALYRRYRPDTFEQVIGQDHVTLPLQRAIANNRVSHAYLFSGPRGCGKTTCARILARCLNCENGPTPTPCGHCTSCRELATGGPGSIDVIEIDAASHGRVDDARELREGIFFAPVQSRFKIYIIDEAHMVTKEGFNALLKVVEEPPPHVKFIFATTEPDKVIGTIRSRTHHYPFRLVPPKVLTDYLEKICVEEHVQVEPGVLPLVVRAGAGSVRDSLSVLDQLLGSAGADGVSYQQATSLLGYTPDALLDEMVDALAAGDGKGVFGTIDKVIEIGQDPRRFAEDLLQRLRDLVIVADVPDALSSGLIDVAADQAQRFEHQAALIGPGELTRAAEVIASGLTHMRGTTAPRLHLELMCARILLPGADVDGRGTHARLDRLERRVGMPGVAEEPAIEQPAPPQWDDQANVSRGPHADVQPAADYQQGARTRQRSVRDGGPGLSGVGLTGPGYADGANQAQMGNVPGAAAGMGVGAPAGGSHAATARQRPATDQTAAPASGAARQQRPAAGPAPDGQATPPGNASRGHAGPTDTGPSSAGPGIAASDQAASDHPAPTDNLGDSPNAGTSHATAADGAATGVNTNADNAPGADNAGPAGPAPQATGAQAPSSGDSFPAQAPSSAAGRLNTAEVRRLWPEVLTAVKGRRRFTWILLSQNAQVLQADVDGLSLAFNSAGARDSFQNGGSNDVLREALIDVLGADLPIHCVVEGTAAMNEARGGEPARQRPAPTQQQAPTQHPTSTQHQAPAQQQAPTQHEAPAGHSAPQDQAAPQRQPGAGQRPAPGQAEPDQSGTGPSEPAQPASDKREGGHQGPPAEGGERAGGSSQQHQSQQHRDDADQHLADPPEVPRQRAAQAGSPGDDGSHRATGVPDDAAPARRNGRRRHVIPDLGEVASSMPTEQRDPGWDPWATPQGDAGQPDPHGTGSFGTGPSGTGSPNAGPNGAGSAGAGPNGSGTRSSTTDGTSTDGPQAAGHAGPRNNAAAPGASGRAPEPHHEIRWEVPPPDDEPPYDPDADVSMSDPNVDETGKSAAELIISELDAEVIEEIEHG